MRWNKRAISSVVKFLIAILATDMIPKVLFVFGFSSSNVFGVGSRLLSDYDASTERCLKCLFHDGMKSTKDGYFAVEWFANTKKPRGSFLLFQATSSEELKRSRGQSKRWHNVTAEVTNEGRSEATDIFDEATRSVKPTWSKRLALAADKVSQAKEQEQSMGGQRQQRHRDRKRDSGGSRRRFSTRSWAGAQVAHQGANVTDNIHNGASLGSLTELTKVLDKQLYTDGLDGLIQISRDSMSSLLGYNQFKGNWRNHLSKSTRNVAVVFGKRLVRDQLTVEYASRIRTLANLFQNEPDFRPSLVCFCGQRARGNHVSDADAGYIFFRHMCEAQGISLDAVHVFIDSKSRDESEAVKRVTKEAKRYLSEWFENVPPPSLEESSSATSDTVHDSFNAVPKKRINVHFSFISTEYHLCNLNDVHHRSPRHSPLQPIQALEEDSKNAASASFRQVDGFADPSDSYANDYDYTKGHLSELPRMNSDEWQGIVVTSWSFQYATYPYVHSKEDAVAFLGKCYLLGEELMPLLVNLKGVVEKTEFFQRDNYLMLASIRRSLVSQVEELGKPHNSLRSKLKLYMQSSIECSNQENYSHGSRDRPIDLVLESALSSLGDCIELVRPAGLHVSSVTKADWVRALKALEYSMSEIQTVCDPDRPLSPSEWGKLVDDDTFMAKSRKNRFEVSSDDFRSEHVGGNVLEANDEFSVFKED